MSSLKDTVGLLDFRSFDWKDTGYNSGGGITPPGLMNPVYICTITVRFSFFIFFFFLQSDKRIPMYLHLLAHDQRAAICHSH